MAVFPPSAHYSVWLGGLPSASHIHFPTPASIQRDSLLQWVDLVDVGVFCPMILLYFVHTFIKVHYSWKICFSSDCSLWARHSLLFLFHPKYLDHHLVYSVSHWIFEFWTNEGMKDETRHNSCFWNPVTSLKSKTYIQIILMCG